MFWRPWGLRRSPFKVEEDSRMILGGRRVSDPPLQGAAMVGHFGYIKCGAGQTLQGVTHVSGPGVIYVPGLYPIPAFPSRLGKGPESFAHHGIGGVQRSPWWERRILFWRPWGLRRSPFKVEEDSRMILGGRRVSDPPLQGAAMVGHFGYIKCGAGQTLQGVTHVSGPGVIYVPGLYPIPAFPSRLGKGPESFAHHGIGGVQRSPWWERRILFWRPWGLRKSPFKVEEDSRMILRGKAGLRPATTGCCDGRALRLH